MINNFDDAFDALIGNEGKFSNDPKDPGNWTGGKIGIGTCDGTMWGISAPVARKHGYTGPMQLLPRDMAKTIAKSEYWDPHQCDQFDPRIAFQVLDAAYNGGDVAQWLQRAAGVKVDGSIGAATIKAVRAMNPYQLQMLFLAQRQHYLTGLQGWDHDGRGWANRISNNLTLGASQ